MKQISRLHVGLGLSLMTLATSVHGQNFLLNEDFDDPALPGWTVYGESSSTFLWDVSEGSFNARGFIGGTSRSLSLDRPLDGLLPSAGWSIETRFYLPVAPRGYSIPMALGIAGTSRITFSNAGMRFEGGPGFASVFGPDAFASTSAALNSWHTLRVTATASHLHAELDGSLFGSVPNIYPNNMNRFSMNVNLFDADMSNNPLRIDYIRIVPEPVSIIVLFAGCLPLLRRGNKK